MATARRPRFVILSSPHTLAGLDAALERDGVVVERVPLLTIVPRPHAEIARELDRVGRFDTLLVSSRESIDAFVAPFAARLRRVRPAVEVWTVGPETARRLRDHGFRPVRRGPELGAASAVRGMRRATPRTVVYGRSDRAGRSVARSLRARGDAVHEIVVYSVRGGGPLRPSVRESILRADALLATSPSTLSELRRTLGPAAFRRWRASARLLVLGERTLRAARGHGVRRVERVPSTSVQALTYYVRRGFRNGFE